jgi:hypothetical protein
MKIQNKNKPGIFRKEKKFLVFFITEWKRAMKAIEIT